MEVRGISRLLRAIRCVWLLVLLLPFLALPSAAGEAVAIDFGAPQPVIDLGPSLIRERINDVSDPNGSWFTISVQNRGATLAARVLTAFSSPGAAVGFEPVPGRPTITQAVPLDSTVVVERAPA